MDDREEDLNDDQFMYDLEELVEFAKENGEVVFTQTEKEEVAGDDPNEIDEIAQRNEEVVFTLTEKKEVAGDDDNEIDEIAQRNEEVVFTQTEKEEVAGDDTNEINEIAQRNEEAVISQQIQRASSKTGMKNVREEAKQSRLRGEKYTGFRRVNKGKTNLIKQDTQKEGRKMGEGCNRKKCETWSTRKCGIITEAERREIFELFWKQLTSWEIKRVYVCTLVIQKHLDNNYETNGDRPRRGMTFFYHLRVGKNLIPVCKKMFQDTLGVGEGMLKRWLTLPGNKASKAIPTKDIPDASQDTPDASNQTRQSVQERLTQRRIHALEVLKSIPTIPAHYVRKDSSRMYLQGDIGSKADLYQLYLKKCTEDGVQHLSRSSFLRIVDELKISVFKPRKDQCDLCYAYKHNNANQEEYENHIVQKNRARQEKEADKEAAIKTKQCHVITCDMMNVQCVPLIKASACYYKLKLIVHNYTVFNLETHDAMNFWWDETITTLEASTYASCLVHYIEEMVIKEYRPTVIIYSDGCTAQNRNSILSNALLHLSSKLDIKIIQKFLIKGHTQMEVDSVHAHIEHGIKLQDIYMPSNMISVTLAARKPPLAPYRAKYLVPSFTLDYSKSIVYPSIRPGSKTDDPVVVNMHWIEYDGAKTMISYKLNYDDELRPLPRRPQLQLDRQNPVTFEAKRQVPIPIPLDKWEDIQSVAPMIPSDCHPYYKSLPHLDNSIRQERRAEKKKSSAEDEGAGKTIKNKRKKSA